MLKSFGKYFARKKMLSQTQKKQRWQGLMLNPGDLCNGQSLHGPLDRQSHVYIIYLIYIYIIWYINYIMCSIWYMIYIYIYAHTIRYVTPWPTVGMVPQGKPHILWRIGGRSSFRTFGVSRCDTQRFTWWAVIYSNAIEWWFSGISQDLIGLQCAKHTCDADKSKTVSASGQLGSSLTSKELPDTYKWKKLSIFSRTLEQQREINE